VEKTLELGNQLLIKDPEYQNLTNKIIAIQSKIQGLLDEYENVFCLREGVIQNIMFRAGCVKRTGQ
jgi:hypothetical protein